MQPSFSNIFFGLGAIFIMRTYYDQYIGTYYNGENLSFYTDTLREKPSFTSRSKNSSYYQFQLSPSRSKFWVVNNGYLIVSDDPKKMEAVNSLIVGDIVTVGYVSSLEDLTRSNQNTVKAVVLSANNNTILSVGEIVKRDTAQKRQYYLIGLGFIVWGFISLWFRKSKGSK